MALALVCMVTHGIGSGGGMVMQFILYAYGDHGHWLD